MCTLLNSRCYRLRVRKLYCVIQCIKHFYTSVYLIYYISVSIYTVLIHRWILYTVEPPNKGHFGVSAFVPCREVVPISEVLLFLL